MLYKVQRGGRLYSMSPTRLDLVIQREVVLQLDMSHNTHLGEDTQMDEEQQRRRGLHRKVNLWGNLI